MLQCICHSQKQDLTTEQGCYCTMRKSKAHSDKPSTKQLQLCRIKHNAAKKPSAQITGCFLV